MSTQPIMLFFKPNLLILAVFGIFIAIAVVAQFQAWGDSARMAGKPKPPFYDELRPFLFVSVIYLFSIIPIFFLGLLSTLFLPGEEAFSPVWIIAHVVYFYVLSCFVAIIWRNVKDNDLWRQRVQKIRSS